MSNSNKYWQMLFCTKINIATLIFLSMHILACKLRFIWRALGSRAAQKWKPHCLTSTSDWIIWNANAQHFCTTINFQRFCLLAGFVLLSLYSLYYDFRLMGDIKMLLIHEHNHNHSGNHTESYKYTHAYSSINSNDSEVGF